MTLRLTNIAKTFPDGTRALLPTELTVETGEIVSLLGPSGCGKTTLLRIIAGLETPDFGSTIWFDNDDVTSLSVERRKVGMVFQSYALFPNMSVRANIGYGLKMQKLSKPEINARVTEVLEMCQLDEFSKRGVDALSGGQRQRVALARAIAPRPRLLLLDEPLSALDASMREALRDELAVLLRKFQITAIFVTHDQDEAMAIADRVAVMSNGRVVQSGTPEELYRNPNSSFVAGFVGNAMHLEGKSAGKLLTLEGGTQHLLSEGSGQNVYVRAEDVRIDEAGSLCGEVETVTFMGTHYRVGIKGIMPNVLTSIFSGQSAPNVGGKVRVSIKPQALMLLPEGEAQA
ncbi:ABC transporter ATP-binding protein [Rhodobacteraceae bacterium nBUS_24]|nr:ABC transporter ATP-binding protein [Marinovum sp.]MBT6097325.1 ABC transporter ATP-binding protein [Marinovum sp.]